MTPAGSHDASSRPDEAAVTRAMADVLGVEPETLWVDVLDTDVPGIAVFSAAGPVGKRSWAGIFDGSKVELDPDVAISRVLAAWGYGPKRTRSARDVAAVAGLLEGQPGSPYLGPSDKHEDDDDEEDDDDDRASRANPPSPPKEVEVDGLLGVEYTNQSSRRREWQTTLLVHPDGRADLRHGDG